MTCPNGPDEYGNYPCERGEDDVCVTCGWHPDAVTWLTSLSALVLVAGEAGESLRSAALELDKQASALEQAEKNLYDIARKFTLEQERARIAERRLEQAEKALAHYARLDHVTEPDEGFVAREALAVLGGQDKQQPTCNICGGEGLVESPMRSAYCYCPAGNSALANDLGGQDKQEGTCTSG